MFILTVFGDYDIRVPTSVFSDVFDGLFHAVDELHGTLQSTVLGLHGLDQGRSKGEALRESRARVYRHLNRVGTRELSMFFYNKDQA